MGQRNKPLFILPNKLYCRWQFNTSTEYRPVPPTNIFTDDSHSVAHYTPHSEMDYGSLLCQASNHLGVQEEPCVFSILPAGKLLSFCVLTTLEQQPERLKCRQFWLLKYFNSDLASQRCTCIENRLHSFSPLHISRNMFLRTAVTICGRKYQTDFMSINFPPIVPKMPSK